ncbi:MAG TPA: hypothetical protein VLU38_01565 [Methanomassiliicoccales archaeon]|nr:hypothetical protein [Methanomassiliicoccales archaeon]
MLTYITVMFSSEGAKPSKVFDALNNMGFRPTTGSYDAVYTWDKQATLDDAISLADKVVATLKGMGVLVKLETVGNNDQEHEEEE